MLMHLSNRLKSTTIQPQWINDEYLACRIDLVCTRSRAQKSFSDADWLAYRNLRNKINNLATRLKREFIETLISNADTDAHKLWKTIKTLLPGSKHDVISSLRDGDSITNDVLNSNEELHSTMCISTCGNTRGYVYPRMWKYTWISVLPHAVIH